MYRARVYVTLKAGVLDPQGGAVERALHALGYAEVRGVRIGKAIEVTLAAPDAETARRRVEEMCRELLANPVMETFEVEAVEAADAGAGAETAADGTADRNAGRGAGTGEDAGMGARMEA